MRKKQVLKTAHVKYADYVELNRFFVCWFTLLLDALYDKRIPEGGNGNFGRDGYESCGLGCNVILCQYVATMNGVS